MRATRFEQQHPVLLHLLLVGLCTLTYLHDRVDIVWSLVQSHSDSATWERIVFGCGTLMLLASAVVETWANAQNARPLKRYWSQLRLSRILLVFAVGLLLPLSGTILLLAGETILILRLSRSYESEALPMLASPPNPAGWRSGFRVAASKWGFAVSMVAFVWTLQDRIAEIGAACSVVLWLLLNFPRARPITVR